MSETPEVLLEKIRRATGRLDRAETGQVVEELIARVYEFKQAGDCFPAKPAATILGELRRKRYFEEMERTADALLDCGQEHPTVQRQYVQALIDRGRLAQARGEVEALIEAARNDPKEYAEARGLRGRILKQSYVDSGARPSRAARRDLARAIEAYAEVYQEDCRKHYWHGINVVACLARARRDGVDPCSQLDEREIAQNILTYVSSLNRRDPWNMWAWGTAVEACVALDRIDEAGRWLNIYLQCEPADAFEFAATYRQLVEVWQLDKQGVPAADLLTPLRGALLRKTGSRVDLQGFEELAARPPRELQARWGAHCARAAAWIDRLGRKLNAVARVENRSGKAVGTAFLVRGEELYERWRGRRVLVTNAHVVDDPAPRGGLSPSLARILFTRHKSAREGRRFRARRLWSRDPSTLDVCLLEIAQPPDGLESLLLAPPEDIRTVEDEERPRLIVAGHPEGLPLQVSIYDNFLEALEPPLLYYRSPTEGGSSGSPVLTEDFDAVAIHRAADHDRGANEGVLASELKKELLANPPPIKTTGGTEA